MVIPFLKLPPLSQVHMSCPVIYYQWVPPPLLYITVKLLGKTDTLLTKKLRLLLPTCTQHFQCYVPAYSRPHLLHLWKDVSTWHNCESISQQVAQLWKYILASGTIVEDEQLQCSLYPVTLCGRSQQVVQLWKTSNCSITTLSPFLLVGNVIVQGSIGTQLLSFLTSISPPCLPIVNVKLSVICVS